MMNKNIIKIVVLIPAYNHPDTVRDVVVNAMKFNPDVMVVDDGSDRGVSEMLSGLDVIIIRHTQNMGKGAAILSGAQKANGLGFTHIITIDADGQHDPGDLPKLISAVEKNPYTIIVGKRDFKKADVPRASVFGRSFSNFWLRVQTGRSVGDTQSGFRAYPLDVLNELDLKEQHYSFEVEVLVRAIWSGVDVVEEDVNVYYPPENKRVTHFLKFRDNLRLTLLNTRLTMRSILPWPHRKIIFEKQDEKVVSIWHPVDSIRAVLTENTSPEKIAIAGGLGIFLGALPLIACHSVIIIMVASFFRLNKVVALSTSQLCMAPFMPAICIETGYFLRNGAFLTEVNIKTIGYQAIYRIYEWLLGSLIIGPLTGIIIALIMYIMAVIIQKGRNGIRE